MLKKIKLQNSTALLTGIILIVFGIFIGFFDFLQQKKEKVFTEVNLTLYKNEMPEAKEELPEKEVEQESEQELSNEEKSKTDNEFKYNYIGMIEIPKINLKTGFVDIESRYNNVDYNVTIINGSTYPTEKNNNLILAAHSGNCTVCYFNNLFDLSEGDIAKITYYNSVYVYKLTNTYEVDKDGTVPIYRDHNKSVLTLITCTRYTNNKQTVFIFEKTN